MAYNEEKLAKLKNLRQLAERIETDYATKKNLEALSGQVEALTAIGGEPNIIETVKVNGEVQPVAGKAVEITVPTEKDLAESITAAGHLKRRIVDAVDGIDLTAEDADQYIYMVPRTGAEEGDQYDEYMVLSGAAEKIGSTEVDLSGYQQKEEGKGLSSNDFTDAEKAKLAGIEFATNAEVAEMLNAVFGAEAAV